MIKDFEYFAPETVEEALTLLSKYKGEAKLIGGGQSLLLLMKQGLVAPRYLIDIKAIPTLDYIKYDEKEGLRIGSLTAHRSIELSSVIRNGFSVLAEMEEGLSSVQIRNWGTIGGNLCHADPAGDPAPPLIALNAKVKMASSSGERVIALEDFFKGYYETVIEADEMLIEIQVSKPLPHTGVAYGTFNLMELDPPVVGTAVSIMLNPGDGSCTDARIVLGAAAPVPMRAKKAEKALTGREVGDNVIEEAAQAASEEANPISDMHFSEEYKRELVRVLVKRTGRKALERAKAV